MSQIELSYLFRLLLAWCYLSLPVRIMAQHNHEKFPIFALKKEAEVPWSLSMVSLPNGELWFGGYNSGIYKWENSFLNPVYQEKNGLPGNGAWLSPDRDGNIWFRTGNKKFGRLADGKMVILPVEGEHWSYPIGAGRPVLFRKDSFFIPQTGLAWEFIGTCIPQATIACNLSEQKVFYFTKTYPDKRQLPQFYRQTIRGKPEQIDFPALSGRLTHESVLFAVLPSGELIFCRTKQGGTIALQNGKVIWEHIPEIRWAAQDADNKSFWTIEQCDEKRLNRTYRLWVWQADRFVYYTFRAPEPLSFSSVTRDPAGNFWIVTDDALFRLFPNVQVYPPDEMMPDNVWTVGEDDAGRLFFGSYGEKMAVLKNGYLHPPPPLLNEFSHWMMGAAQVNGQLWLPIESGKGIARIGKNLRCDTILSGNTFYFLRQNPDGSIAGGSCGKGLFYLPPRANPKNQCEWKIIGREKGISIPNISSFVQDTFGRIWGGHFGRGMFVYDPKKDTAFTWERKNPNQDYGVVSFERDAWGNIWFGTSRGLRLYRPSLQSFNPETSLKPVLGSYFDGQFVTSIRLKNRDTLLIASETLVYALDLPHFYQNGAESNLDFSEKGIALSARNSGLHGGAGQNGICTVSRGRVFYTGGKWLECQLPQNVSLAAEHQYLSVEKIIFLDEENAERLIVPNQTTWFPFNLRMAQFILHSWSNLNFPPDSIQLIVDGEIKKKVPFVLGQPLKIECRFAFPWIYSIRFQALRFGKVLASTDIVAGVQLGWAEILAICAFLVAILSVLILQYFNKIKSRQAESEAEKAVLKIESKQSTLELANQKLQITAFVNQLNPHFLKNVLQPIQGRVFRHDPELANSMSDLASMLDIIVKAGKQQPPGTHLLADELMLSEKYLNIQQGLYKPDKLMFSMPDENLRRKFGSLRVPVMCVQMFVENAVLHGIEHLTYGGLIKIGLEDLGTHLQVTVNDNGVGSAASRHIERDKGIETTSRGISMMKDLFEALNQDNQHKLSIEVIQKYRKNLGQGVLVQVKIPKDFRYEYNAAPRIKR